MRLGTGSKRERNAAEMINGCTGLFGEIGAMCDNFTAGAPIDAPEILPAGCCNSIDWTDGRGRPLPMQAEFRRGIF